MDKLIVKGGNVLNGTVKSGGSKNAILPLLFSTLLAEGEHIFHNVPRLKDVESALDLLKYLNCESVFEGNELRVTVRKPQSIEAPYDLVRKMRASILCLGPLLARYKKAIVSLPGGCAIGSRPIDMHLEALKILGATTEVVGGYVHAQVVEELIGGSILFDSPTVGGTENILMAAVMANGTTIIENAAKEPEVVDLAMYLKKMGAKIKGAGTSVITVDGVSSLTPSEHTIIPDRIEAGTLLLAGAITGGEVTVTNCCPNDLEPLLIKLKESGFNLYTEKDSIHICANSYWQGVDITTAPHPAFPTDLQAQFMALMTQCDGASVITETVFENRFMHVQELVRLNAKIHPRTHVAVVRGSRGSLCGAPVMATDLRASACLVLAGLIAQGETLINRIYHLDRGYENLEGKLEHLGAQVKRL